MNELSIKSPDDFIDATEELIKETVNWYNLANIEIMNEKGGDKLFSAL